MRSSSHRRHARSAHGRLEEPAERIGVRRYDPTYGGRGAVQNQSAGNDGGEPGGTRTRDPMIKRTKVQMCTREHKHAGRHGKYLN
jgi:hypothetical protein